MEPNSVTDEADPSERAPRVLFVDDSPDERELFPLRFRGQFSRFVVAASTAEALEALEDGTTELVLSDIALPDASGLELVRRMREMAPEVGGAVPAVAVSGRGSADDLDRAYVAGFSGYLVKPYDNLELITVVERVTPFVAALRRLRERLLASAGRQRGQRERLFVQRKAVLRQRAKHMLKTAGVDARETARLQCVVAAARIIAEEHFGRPVDELEISTSKKLDENTSSWILIAVCDRDLLFVEVIDGPGSDYVARRLDT